jgi:hypothetical protein
MPGSDHRGLADSQFQPCPNHITSMLTGRGLQADLTIIVPEPLAGQS